MEESTDNQLDSGFAVKAKSAGMREASARARKTECFSCTPLSASEVQSVVRLFSNTRLSRQ